MADVRRILIIFVIAVLFSVFVFTTIDAAYPSPEYRDYCDKDFEPAPPMRERPSNHSCPDTDFNETEMQECREQEGEVRYDRNEYGCSVGWECSFCQKRYNDARQEHDFWSFIIASILGLIAVAIGLFLPVEKGSVHEWVGSGLMLGGVITIFAGTVMFFGDLHRWLKPAVILLELLLVIYLAYRKLGSKE